MQHLPFKNYLLKHVLCLNPSKIKYPKSTNAISNMPIKIVGSLGKAMTCVFCLENNESVEDFCNKVRAQWRLYLLEDEENFTLE